jgi:hypothetical protein
MMASRYACDLLIFQAIAVIFNKTWVTMPTFMAQFRTEALPMTASLKASSYLPVLLLLTGVLGLASCSNTAEIIAAEEAAAAEAAQAEAGQAALEAEFEAERLRQERLIAEDRAREARQAEERARAEEQARQSAAEAERQAQIARQEAAARRQEDARRAEEREQAVAQQQARIAELRGQIAANNTEAANLDTANNSLREAVQAAEHLAEVLMEEQQKYAARNENTGQLEQALAKERIDELTAEVERLRAEAAALAGRP